jgi:hypothetical protein
MDRVPCPQSPCPTIAPSSPPVQIVQAERARDQIWEDVRKLHQRELAALKEELSRRPASSVLAQAQAGLSLGGTNTGASATPPVEARVMHMSGMAEAKAPESLAGTQYTVVGTTASASLVDMFLSHMVPAQYAEVSKGGRLLMRCVDQCFSRGAGVAAEGDGGGGPAYVPGKGAAVSGHEHDAPVQGSQPGPDR